MLKEKLLTLKTGRCIKLIARRLTSADMASSIEVEILMKDPNESNFRPLIGCNHPIYQRLTSVSNFQRKLLELQYSGITKPDIQKVITELGSLFTGKNIKV